MKFHLDAPNFGRMSEKRAIKAAANEATTITAADTVGGVVTMTPTAGRALTVATAATIVSLLGDGVVVGSSFELTVVNVAASTHAITLTGAAGITLGGASGMETVAAATSATYVGVVTNVGTPAVTFYRKAG
tara:strand:+ start:149 stop:544 length:396 start_codon:yes stop_codon:yes gene_type:complete